MSIGLDKTCFGFFYQKHENLSFGLLLTPVRFLQQLDSLLLNNVYKNDRESILTLSVNCF